ncbi:unnamed protein product [Orchesella dallaii]|uniref:Ion transport domain-containing protein n=1 Tax=Orchesella dallaii TaxID=48710 RepID=A0ABP1Q8W9_9HEXA
MVSHLLAPNKDVCCAKASTNKYSWINTPSNFDNVFEGYLSLFQVATFEGWIELMESSVNAVGENAQYEGNTLEMLLTPTQRNYYIAMKNLGRRKPQKVTKRPKTKCFSFFYDLAMSKKLESLMYIVILANTIVETFQVYDHGNYHKNIFDGFNAFFCVLYMFEAAIKLTGLGYFYFTVPWNIFDLILLFASLMNVCIREEIFVEYPIPPSLLRIVRVSRIGRVLRLVKAAKGIRKLLYALVVSLPALFNIGALLGLITFIYAVLGMALFGKAPLKDAVDETFNFRTFFNSNLLLLRLMTAAGWNEVLESLTVTFPVCGAYRPIECGGPGEPECPNRALVLQRQMEVKFQKQFPSRRFLDIVSSTRIWKVQRNAALKIQKAWRRYLNKKRQNEKPQVVTRVERKQEVLNSGITAHGGLGHMMRRLGNVAKK